MVAPVPEQSPEGGQPALRTSGRRPLADRDQRRRRRRQVIRRRRVVAVSLVGVVAVSGFSLAADGLPFSGGSDEEQDAAAAPPAPAPPPTEALGAAGDEAGSGSGSAAEGGADATVVGEPCDVEPAGVELGPGVVSAAALGASALGCALPSWQALPPTTLEVDDPEMLLAQVTREQPVDPIDYAPDDLVILRGDFYEARAEVGEQLDALLDAAAEEGHPLTVTSGFRSHETQAGTFADWAGQLGEERAEVISARPGYSEHQLGLAVDLAGTCSYQCFGDTEEGRWVAENAHRWGFIIRYPEDGYEVTGYAWEPWHLRYVGPRAAWGMHLADEIYWENFQPVAARAAGLD